MKHSEHSVKKGFSFGLTSAIITTLGLMIGLYVSLGTRLAVIGGILTIAIADAFSDALGIHISEESEGVHTDKEVWISTISTFLSKLLFALTFLVPVLFFKLVTAIRINIMWGFIILGIYSYYIGNQNKKVNKWYVVAEHLFIATIVIFITHFTGIWIASMFGN